MYARSESCARARLGLPAALLLFHEPLSLAAVTVEHEGGERQFSLVSLCPAGPGATQRASLPSETRGARGERDSLEGVLCYLFHERLGRQRDEPDSGGVGGTQKIGFSTSCQQPLAVV